MAAKGEFKTATSGDPVNCCYYWLARCFDHIYDFSQQWWLERKLGPEFLDVGTSGEHLACTVYDDSLNRVVV